MLGLFYTYVLDAIKRLVPQFIAVILVILNMLLFRLPEFSGFMVSIDLMVIFYSTVYNPVIMPLWFTFVLGIIQDSLYGTPLGSTALVNMVAQLSLLSYRKIIVQQPFLATWLSFSIFLLATIIVKTIFESILLHHLAVNSALIAQLLISTTLYPLFHNTFSQTYKLFSSVKSNA